MRRERAAGERGPQLIPGEERRRSQRVMIRIAVTLHYTVHNQPAMVRANTIGVNDHGAMLICSRALPAGTKLELESDRTRQRQRCRVTRTPRETQEGFQIPIEFEGPAKGFWHISFPPTD